MRNLRFNKIFAILCSILLVFSSISPSIAFATTEDEPRPGTIKLGLKGENRGINYPSLKVSKMKQNGNQYSEQLYYHYNYQEEQFELSEYDIPKVDLQANYQVSLLVGISEWTENYESYTDYTFIDQLVVTGEDLLSLGTLEIPTKDQLKLTTLEAESFQDSNLHLFVGDGISFEQADFYENIGTSLNLLVRNEQSFPISFDLHSKNSENKHYFISDTLDFSNSVIKLEEYIPSLVHLQFDTKADVVRFAHDLHYASYELGEDNYVSKGKYSISYNLESGITWEGEIVADENTVSPIVLPETPNELQVSIGSVYADWQDPTELNIHFESRMANGQFSYNPYDTEYSGKILSGETVVSEISTTTSYGNHLFSMTDYPSGEYTLYLETKTDDQPIFGTATFQYKAPFQELQGTLLKIKDGDSFVKDTTVTVYQNVDGDYELITVESASADGEVFIPDAFLLNDQEFLLVVESASEKLLYVDKFIGQSQNEIILDSSTFKPFSIETNNLEEVTSGFVFGDFTLHKKVNTVEKIGTNIDTKVFWSGKNNEGTIGYEYLAPVDFANGNQLIDLDWVSYKPAKKYEEFIAKLKFNGPAKISGLGYDEIKVFYEKDFKPSFTLTVMDGNTRYEANLAPSTNEVAFGEITGAIASVNEKMIYTKYTSELIKDSLRVSGPDIKLTYELKDSSGKTTQLETDQIYYIPLTEKLAEGSYTIKLVDSTTNDDVLLFELEESFEIGNESTSDELPITIPFNINTPYGQLLENSWPNLVIYDLYNEGTPYESYGQIAHYEYNEDLDNFNITWRNRSFDTSKTYKVVLSVTNINSNEHILEIKDMTGKELLELSESNPLEIKNGLHKLVIDPSEVTSGTVSTPHYEIEIYYLGMNSRYFYGYGKNTVYVSDGTYSVLANLTDDKVKKIFIESDIPVKEDTTVKLTNNGLAEIKAFNGEQKLPIFNISNQSHVNRSYNPDQLYDHFITKGNYETLSLLVGIENQYDTPWGYHLIINDQSITQDTNYQFTGEIDGEIDYIHVVDNATSLQANLQLNSGVFRVSGIYHAIPNPYRAFSLLTTVEPENPVRKYNGLFDTLNEVKPNYTLKDSKGNVISSGYSTSYSLRYLDISLKEALANGTYTLELNIPTAPRESIKLEKTFTVGESGPFVNILTPSNTVTNADEVTVNGAATESSMLTAILKKGETTVESKTITTTAEGTFEVSFNNLTEGDYTVVVQIGEVSDQVNFTIDRTAPEKAKDLEITEVSEGLKVTWTGEEDAVSYKVAVKENDGEFIEADAQKTTSYVITNVKPGASYEVKVTSVDHAGNASVSDVASFKVDDFVTTQVNVEDIRNSYGLVVIGDTLNVTLEGSYKEGFTAKAFITIDGEAKEVTLNYNETTNKYEGSLSVVEGNIVIESVKGYILDGDKQTAEKSQVLNWSVGSTVTGKITDGIDAVNGATIQLKGDTGNYKTTSNELGAFEFKGIKSGTYTITSTIEGRTKNHKTVEVGESKVQAIDEITVDTYVASPVFKFVDSIEQKAITKELLVRITGPNNYILFGSINEEGQFAPFGSSKLSNLVTGPYTVTVYGDIIYQNTTEIVTLKKGQSEYTVTVKKDNVETKDIVISLPEDVEIVNDISLYSPSVSGKYNYQEGSHYDYYVQVGDDRTITFKDVIVAKDYYLNISVDGYMNYYKVVDLTSEQNLTPELEKGREISGTVTASDNQGIGNVYVYANAGNTYASAYTNAQGEYTLKGLSKNHDVNIYVSLQTYLDANVTISKGEEDLTDQDIQLVKAGSITGKVVDKDGEPVQYASVYAYSNSYYSKWTRTAPDGTFSVDGLKEGEKYTLEISSYGYPSFTKEDVVIGDLGDITLQAEGEGDFKGVGNYLAVSKSTVVEGDTVSYTLGYQNNGEQDSTNVPVTITLPEGLELFEQSVQLNGKAVTIANGKVIIPSVKVGESGKVTFDAKVKTGVSSPSLTTKAQITEEGSVLSATASVVFVTLEAPAEVGTSKLKVYGTAKLGSTVEIYANNTLVGQSTVDSKWWYADIALPVVDLLVDEKFTLTAKVTNGESFANSAPVKVTYSPSVPTIEDVTVTAGWNGDVKLNPYTGVATFAITENTWMPTSIKFSEEVESAKLIFLGKEFDMNKDGNTFTFDGDFGTWSTYGEQLLQVKFKKGDVEVTMPLMNIIVLIDPSGYVFEGSMDNRLEGVQAVVEVKQDNEWVAWDAEKFGQVNPQVTDEDGRYGWDVIHGEWRVIFTKDGYEPYISRIMSVPPAETELNIPMVKIADPSLVTTTVTESDLSVTFDRYMDVESVDIKLFEVTGNGNVEVTGTVEAVNQKAGYQSISTPTEKAVGFAGQDSNGEDGFFSPDEAKSVASTFKFVPASALKTGTSYVLVVNGEIQDTEGRTLGESVEFEFITKAATGPVTTPPSDGGVTPPAQGTTEVNESDVTSQVNDSSKSVVSVKGSAISESQPTATVEITPAALKAIANAGKPLVINYGEIQVEVPAAVVKDAVTNTSAKTKFEVAFVKDANVPGDGTTLSNVYEFAITANNKVTAFDEPIVIKIPLNGSAVKNLNNVAAYYLNEDTNKLEFVISKYDNGAVTFKTKHFSKFVVVENNKTFKDSAKHWAKESIDSLASKGIVSGKSVDTFAPNDSITRAEFASILSRMLNLPKQSYEGIFSDVQASSWATADIEAAYSAGIIAGFNGKFNPNATISRQDMAAMIVRAAEYLDASVLKDASKKVTYADASLISSYAKENVQIVSALGIASGRIVSGKQVFAPKDNATRAEAATMLNKLLEVLTK